MIVTGTTAVNTGVRNGVVSLLQNCFVNNRCEKPTYIGCQHHILDTILKHVLNEYFTESTVSPLMNYSFIHELTNEYEKLQIAFNNNGTELSRMSQQRWRDDMDFLKHIITCYRFFLSE